MKKNFLRILCFVLVSFAFALVFTACNQTNKEPQTFTVSYVTSGAQFLGKSVAVEGDETVKEGDAFSFTVRLYGGYLPDNLIVRLGSEKIDPVSVTMSGGTAYGSDISESLNAGEHIVCEYIVSGVREKPYVGITANGLSRALVTLPIIDENDHAVGYRVAKEYYFSEDYAAIPYMTLDDCCESVVYFEGEVKSITLPFGEHYFLLCDSKEIGVYREREEEELEYFPLLQDRFDYYVEAGSFVYLAGRAKAGDRVTVHDRALTYDEENEAIRLAVSEEYEYAVMIPRDLTDASLTVWIKEEGAEPTEQDDNDLSYGLLSADGRTHWYDVSEFSDECFIELPSYADRWDYYLSDAPDKDRNVKEIERVVLNGKNCLHVQKSDLPNGVAFLRSKVKPEFTVAERSSEDPTAYYISFRLSKPTVQNDSNVTWFYGAEPVFYAKGGSAEESVFVFENGYFYAYVFMKGVDSVILEYSSSPEGEKRMSSLTYSVYRKSYNKENFETVGGYSGRVVTDFSYGDREMIEIPCEGSVTESYLVSFSMILEDYTATGFNVDFENSDFGEAQAYVSNFETETNAHGISFLKNADEWGENAVIGVSRELYLDLVAGDKTVLYVDVMCGDEGVPAVFFPLTDVTGRPIEVYKSEEGSKAFVLRLGEGYYDFEKPLRLVVTYEEEEEEPEWD